VQSLIMDYQLTIPAIMRRAEQHYADREIVSRRLDKSWHRYCYGDFVRRAKQLGGALSSELGLEPGDRVATLAWNTHQHCEVYLGSPSAGFVTHTLNPRLHPDDLAYIATHAGDRVLVADKSLWQLADALRGRVGIEHVVAVGDGPTPGGAIDYEDLLATQTGDPPGFPDLDERSAAAMCYTSGTTGRPKGVVYSHRAIVLHSLGTGLKDTVDMGGTDTVMPVVPMFHANAWGFPFTCTLVGAGQVFPGPHLDPVSLLDALAEHRVTVTAGVPTIWMGILQTLDASPGTWDLSALRVMVVGGSAPPRAMIEGFQRRHGLSVLHAWGMTEMTPLGSTATPSHRELELDEDALFSYRSTQGRPTPLVEIRARGADGIVPWDGETMGELEVRGPWIACSYYEAPEAADRWTDDGWFRTGDVVTIDGTGTIRIQDREKDLVKSGGEWISTVALENALMGHPAVAEAAVIAVSDERWAERPLAVVVFREGASATPDELRGFLEPHFAKWWLPDRFEAVDEIPKTAVGKFRKTALRERFG
jgi:fatty-acyl-CoA synthase